MAAETFVQLRVPAAHLAFGALTRRPGRTADILVEPVIRKPQQQAFRSLAILKGIEPSDIQRLTVELEARYVAATRLGDAAGDRLAFEIDHDKMPEGLFGTLIAFQAAFGPAWLHFSKGTLMARAKALHEPEESARRLRQALRMAGIKGTVRIVELDGEQLTAWRQLILWHAATADPSALESPESLARELRDRQPAAEDARRA